MATKTPVMLDPRKIKRLDFLTRAALGATAAFCAAAPLHSSLTIDPKDTGLPLAAFVAMVAISVLYQPHFRNLPRLAVGATVAADLIAYALVLGTFSYIAAASPWPLIHPVLAQIDRALHFDWLAYYHFIKNHPPLAALLTLAYDGMIAEIGLVTLALFLLNDLPRLRIVLDGFALCALITIILSAIFPAVEALAYFNIYPMIPKGQGFVTGIDRVDAFLALHYATTTTIPIIDAKGIVCFPSFHTACAVISVVGAFSRRWLRWPVLAWSILLIAATPVDGGHYLTDVIAGFGAVINGPCRNLLAGARASTKRTALSRRRAGAVTDSHLSVTGCSANKAVILTRLRRGDFLTGRWLQWCPLFVVAFFSINLLLHPPSSSGQTVPLGSDFSEVWAAGKFVLAGEPAKPFDPIAHFEKQRQLFGEHTAPFGWCYPPFFLALAAVLALLPYLLALATWQLSTFALYLAAMKTIARPPSVLSAIGLFPAVLVNLIHPCPVLDHAAVCAIGELLSLFPHRIREHVAMLCADRASRCP
jgi:hypothetical protein